MDEAGPAANSIKSFFRTLGKKNGDNAEDVTEEIISMVNEGHEQGVLQDTEAEMITNIFEFGDKEAHDIMTNRKSILAIENVTTLDDAICQMLEAGKSRFPVFQENMDNIVGILHFRDAILAQRKADQNRKPICEIDGLIREAMFVPETKNIADLFRTMQRMKTQMVIVIDEYGQTKGILAMEDILEEIVGNIMDEYDKDEEHIEETGNQDEYIIEGITPLKELEERFPVIFHEEEFDTLNGYMISKMDRIPEENEDFSITVDGYSFTILSVKNKMIKSVLVSKIKEPEAKKDAQKNT